MNKQLFAEMAKKASANSGSLIDACLTEIIALRSENASLKEAISLSEDSRLMDEYLKLERANARQAERIAELEEDIKESDAIRERCAYLLAETAVALKGPEKALHRHGWQDLPKVAQEQTTTIAAQSAALAMAESALIVAGSTYSEFWKSGMPIIEPEIDEALAAINALLEVAEKKASE